MIDHDFPKNGILWHEIPFLFVIFWCHPIDFHWYWLYLFWLDFVLLSNTKIQSPIQWKVPEKYRKKCFLLARNDFFDLALDFEKNIFVLFYLTFFNFLETNHQNNGKLIFVGKKWFFCFVKGNQKIVRF